jgi:hypothetical protein
VAVICILTFTIPSFILLVVLNPSDLEPAILLFIIYSLISPIAGLLTWLIDKGSRGENAVLAIKALGIWPFRIFGFLVGGMIGYRLAGSIGGIVGAILFYLIGRYIGLRFGSLLSIRLAEHFS